MLMARSSEEAEEIIDRLEMAGPELAHPEYVYLLALGAMLAGDEARTAGYRSRLEAIGYRPLWPEPRMAPAG